MKKSFYFLLIALTALSVSCKKDNSLPINTFVLDGVSKNIESAIMDSDYYSQNKYEIYLTLDQWNEYLFYEFDGESHLGKNVDLRKKDPVDRPGWYWVFSYLQHDGLDIDTNGNPDSEEYPAFESGTMYTENLGEDENGVPTLRLVIKNGKVKGSDGKIHTVALNFKGKTPLNELSR